MQNNSNSIVVCRLPKAGLGNQLFPLVKGLAFANLNNLHFISVGFYRFKIGPYLRGEKSKRNYLNYFVFQNSFFSELTFLIRLKKYSHDKTIKNPSLEIVTELKKDSVYLFDAIPHWSNYFDGLRENRKLVINLFIKSLRKDIIDKLNVLKKPIVGIHVRMGDYKTLKSGQDFKKLGNTRTPEPYFVDLIKGIREVHGSELPVSIFTDGFKEEFELLFSLPNVLMIEGNLDIVDLLLLSTSKIIVTSTGSSFSYWAGFLSDAPIILHPDHIYMPIRGKSSEFFEGAFDSNNKLLVSRIRDIPSAQ